MSFLYPAFLIGAIAAAIPIVLHLLRRDVAPDVPFSAVRLLQRTPIEQTRRRRLREWLLLAARVTALLLLAAAFARPYFVAAAGSRVHVVAVDRSFSMAAPGRFERALALAREAIDQSASAEQVAVIAFDDRADVVAPAGSAGAARAALDGLRPAFGATRYQPLVQRAIEVGDERPTRLTIVSDLQRAGWTDFASIDVPPDFRVEPRTVESRGGNAAVVAVRREPDHVVGTIRLHGDQPLSGNARVLQDDRTVAAAPFMVPPTGTIDVRIPHRSAARGRLAVEIDDGSGYPADNRRYAVLDAPARSRVLVVTATAADADQSGFYVTRALESEPIEDAAEVRRVSGAALGRLSTDELSQSSAVVLLSTRGIDRHARELLAAYVRAGGGVFAAASPDLDPSMLSTIMGWSGFSAVEQEANPVALAATDLRHPIFRPFGPLTANLGQVRFARVWRVRADGWDVAARFTDGSPALLERREGEGRIVLFASDLDRRWNDFPLHPAFVPFAIESIRYAAPAASTRREYLVGDVPAGVKAEPGIQQLPSSGRLVAVNVDTTESATASLTADEFAGMLKPGPPPAPGSIARRAQQAEGQQSLWRYGVMLLLAVLAGESMLGRVR